MQIAKCVSVTALMFLLIFMLVGCKSAAGLPVFNGKTVGRDVTEENFKEFYYTYSKTVNPPIFQRYRFYMEDGKPMFYHEKREGEKVFLTEEDITVCGTMELTEEEWNTFWGYMCSGTVKNREENNKSGGSGPWLYLYWDGDNEKCQQFSFNEEGTDLDFEEFCIGLKEKQIGEDACIPEGYFDGESSGYDWALEELKLGKWVQFTPENDAQCSLSINDGNMEYSDGSTEPAIFEYSIPEDTVKYGRPDIEEWVELYAGDELPFNYVYFHEEQVGDTEYDVYPMISFVTVPNDDAPVIVTEFVRDRDADYFPKEFKSSVVRLYLGE